MRTIFGREPAMAIATLVALLQAISLFFGFSTDAQGAVNAALVAVGGIVVASLVSADGALPLLTGVGKAVIAVVLAFGGHVPANVQVGIMAVLTVLAGLAVRTQVTAPVAAQQN